MVFSLHLRKYLMHLPRLERMVHGYLTADMSYVMFTRRFETPSNDPKDQMTQAASLAGNTFMVWTSWIVASFVRHLFGQHHSAVLGLGLCRHFVLGGHFVFLGQHPHANFCGKRGCGHGHHRLSLALEIEHRAGHWRGSALKHELRAIWQNARGASGMSFFEGTDVWTLAVIVGLAGVTVLTRSFFFISSEEWSLARLGAARFAICAHCGHGGRGFARSADAARRVFANLDGRPLDGCRGWGCGVFLAARCALDHCGGHAGLSAFAFGAGLVVGGD
jgi:hypothetical protein